MNHHGEGTTFVDSFQQIVFDAEKHEGKPISAVQRHMQICTEINRIFADKNEDYGDSFHLLFQQEGFASARIRLGDKYNRFCTLTRKKVGEQKVKDESIRDTLIDMAGYAILTIMELDRMEET